MDDTHPVVEIPLNGMWTLFPWATFVQSSKSRQFQFACTCVYVHLCVLTWLFETRGRSHSRCTLQNDHTEEQIVNLNSTKLRVNRVCVCVCVCIVGKPAKSEVPYRTNTKPQECIKALFLLFLLLFFLFWFVEERQARSNLLLTIDCFLWQSQIRHSYTVRFGGITTSIVFNVSYFPHLL